MTALTPAKFRSSGLSMPRPLKARARVRQRGKMVMPKLPTGRPKGAGRSAPPSKPKMRNSTSAPTMVKSTSFNDAVVASNRNRLPVPASNVGAAPAGGGTGKASPSARAMERANPNASFRRGSGSLAKPPGGAKLAGRKGR